MGEWILKEQLIPISTPTIVLIFCGMQKPLLKRETHNLCLKPHESESEIGLSALTTRNP